MVRPHPFRRSRAVAGGSAHSSGWMEVPQVSSEDDRRLRGRQRTRVDQRDAQGEGHQNHDQASGLALRVTVRSWSAVAFSLLYVGLCRILGLVVSCRRGKSDKDIELMVLRHQARVLERQLHRRVRYRPADRAILAALSRLLPRARWRSFLVTPETLMRWHRESARGKWRRWRAQGGTGRPPMAAPMVELIMRLGRENRRWGCIRIPGKLRKLGIRVSQLHS